MRNLDTIRHLFNTYAEIKRDSTTKDIETSNVINSKDGRYSHLRIANTLLNWFNILFYHEDELSSLSKKAEKIREKVYRYTRDINYRLSLSSSETKAAALADKSNLEFTKSYIYTPGSSTFNLKETTAQIVGNKIIGLNKNDKYSIPESINGSVVTLEKVKLLMIDGVSVHECIAYNENYIKIQDDEEVINKKKKITFEAISNTPSSKDIEMTIDRFGYGVFNTIEIHSDIPYIYTVYTSNDGVTFEKVNKERILTSALNLSIDNSTDRYIKIISHFSKPETNNGYGYIYRWKTNAIIVGMARYESESVYQTENIPINKNAEFIAIDTCDNFSNNNVSIDYYLSINNGNFRHLKPLRKVSRTSLGTKSILPIDDFISNKVGDLKEFTHSAGKNIFNAKIYSSYLSSNIFRYFNRSEPFLIKGSYVSVTGIVLKDKTIKVQDTIYINDIPYTGDVKIYSGINTIKFQRDQFKELFDINNSNYKLDKNKYIINTSNSEIEVVDTNYLRNGFTLSHQIFDWILGTELKVGDDIELINSESTFKISANANIKNINIALRNKVSHIDNVRLRVEMKSLDKHTQPNIRRVIFKIA